MKLFVTGGAGYIGGAVSEELLRQGHEVTIYDSLVTGYLAAIPSGADFIHADLDDMVGLEQALAAGPYDGVLHFAGLIEAGESMANPGKYFRDNLRNSLDLIEAVQRAGITRILFSSSAAVYQTSDEPLREDSPLGPSNVYGQTKLMVEDTLDWYHRIHGLRYAALRYFNASGALPGRGEAHQPESHLIPLTLQVALGQRPKMVVNGTDYPTPDGTCIRDYVHLADLAYAHILALEALDEQEKLIFNLGSGRGYSIHEILEAARSVTGHPIPADEGPRRVGDPARLVATSEMIQSQLGWEPTHSSLEEIMQSAWEWHQSHPNGYGEAS